MLGEALAKEIRRRETIHKFSEWLLVSGEYGIEPQENAAYFRNSAHSSTFASTENIVFDTLEHARYLLCFCRDGGIHATKHFLYEHLCMSIVLGNAQKLLCLKHAVQAVERLYYFVACGNEEVFTDNEINFLRTGASRSTHGREVEHHIVVVRECDGYRIWGGRDDFFLNARIDAKLAHHRIKFLVRWRLKVNPIDLASYVPRHHMRLSIA